MLSISATVLADKATSSRDLPNDNKWLLVDVMSNRSHHRCVMIPTGAMSFRIDLEVSLWRRRHGKKHPISGFEDVLKRKYSHFSPYSAARETSSSNT